VVEVVKNLLGGFIDRLLNNPLLEELAGYFLYQPDTERVKGADAVYLLEFFRRGF
jgi:hypothetical protein